MGEAIKLQTLIPAKDRLDLFQFHPYTSLKATLIKSQSGKWTHFTPLLSYFPSLSHLESIFKCLPLFPDSAALFKWCQIRKAHHKGWLITSPDACIFAILFRNWEIKESRDICCQAPTLERPETHLSLLKWLQWCIKPFRKPLHAITAGDYVPYSTLG